MQENILISPGYSEFRYNRCAKKQKETLYDLIPAPPSPPQRTVKGGQEQFSVAKSLLSQDNVHYVGYNELWTS